MRAELTFMALACESNRFLLCRLAAEASRKLHRPNTRVEDTMNDAFARLAGCRPRVVPEILEPASIEQRRAA
jgi:hypothetical protein